MRNEVVFILLVSPASYVVWVNTLVGNLAAGAYTAITALLCLVISGLWNIQELNQNRHAKPNRRLAGG